MKVVIMGADGLLGQACRQAFGPDAIALRRCDADVTRLPELRAVFGRAAPTHVVNCAGYTQVDRAETEREAAFAINAVAAGHLARLCREYDCTLIHPSTDYVFGRDADRDRPYEEIDAPAPLNVYGTSKWAGETQVQAICPRHFVVRTCGLYGHVGGRDFVRALFRKAREGQPTRVVQDQVCTPTPARDVAQALVELTRSTAYGLYHVTSAGSCSWFAFAQTLFAMKRLKTPILATSSAEYGAVARRPHYSVLSGEKWRRAGFTPLRSWREALELTLTTAPASSFG